MAAKETQRWQLPLWQFLTLVVLTISLVVLVNFAKALVDNYRLEGEKAAWQARIDQEQAEHERLLAQQAFVQSEAYQRQLAHEMGLYAPDERPLVLVLPPEMAAEAEAESPVFREAETIELPRWQQWWTLFFGGTP